MFVVRQGTSVSLVTHQHGTGFRKGPKKKGPTHENEEGPPRHPLPVESGHKLLDPFPSERYPLVGVLETVDEL